MDRYLIHNDLSDEKKKLLGRIEGYSVLGMHKDAVVECKRLIRLDPNDPYPFVDLGSSCEDSGQVEKAIKYYRYAIKRFPTHSRCLSRLYTNLGYCLEKYKKQHDEAMVCYEKALELDSCNEWALNNIGAILNKKGKWKESLSYYLEAYKTCKQGYGSVCDKITHNLAWAFYLCKNYLMAWHIYSNLASECPEKKHVLSDYGCVYYKMKNYEKAFDLFDKARSMYPKVRYYHRLCQLVKKKIEQKA